MHSTFNQRISNSNQNTGNNTDYMASLAHMIQVNDGTRSFIPRTVDCHDHNCPYGESDETRLQITHGDHFISNISDGFITFTVELTLKMIGINKDAFNDTDELFKIFVGFKDSNQILEKLQIYANGVSTGYMQNECLREGFAYSVIKPKQEKMTRRYVHSPYENVQKYSPSVCGTYITTKNIKNGEEFTVQFEVILPFDDILALEAFDLFPNGVVGDIELRYYVKPAGLVWCQVDPQNVREYKEYMEGDRLTTEWASNPSSQFHHQFQQINVQSEITTALNVTPATADTPELVEAIKGPATLLCTSMRILSNKANMFGHGVTETSKNAISNIVSQGLIIPAQELEYNAFALPATENGIQANINVTLGQVTCMSVLFPKNAAARTVFENPMYGNLQLIIDGKSFPDEVLSTNTCRFLEYQLVASDLHRGIECTKEFEDSITMAKNRDSDRTRYSNTLSDATSFMWNVQTERNNAGYCFDGLDSGGQNVQIQIRGEPIYSGKNDTYFNLDGLENASLSRHPPPPQIWFCKDTYWILGIKKLIYMRNQAPKGSQEATPNPYGLQLPLP